VRILLVGAKMDVAELGTSQNLMPFADSGAVVLRGNQTVCVQGDPVTIIGGPQVQAGTIVQGRGMPTSAQLVASQLTIDKVTGRTLSTTTQRIE
jgi:hypothetical protein